MSYDLRIAVKVADTQDKFIDIATPEYDSPTYNLGKLFRTCMDWDYEQSHQNENGDYETTYYNCEVILPNIIKGLNELENNSKYYKQYLPDNGWGTIGDAIESLTSLKDEIYNTSDQYELDIKYLYMHW